MAFSPNSSLENFQPNESTNILDSTLDCAITALKKCLCEYHAKAQENGKVLEELGWNANLLPQDLRKELKNILADNEVFSMGNVGSKEMMTINPSHVLNSLAVDQELAEMRTLKTQMDSILSQLHFTNYNIQRKLEAEKVQASFLDEKVNEKIAEGTMLKGKLERLQWDLNQLLNEASVLEKPKFSLEEIKDLSEELDKLNGEVAIVKTKLEKYNNLPLTEKEATKHLVKLQQELTQVKNEISKRVTADF